MKKIRIIGGDNRLKITAKKLREMGYSVETSALFEQDLVSFEGDILLLPVPTTKDNQTIYTPLTNKKIFLDDIAHAITNDQLILTCGYTFPNKNCTDYGKIDSYAIKNAVPTAEGAIKLAIENTDFTLLNSRVLVIGYGRVGKVLAHKFAALGSLVTVAARNGYDLSLAKTFGFDTVNTLELNDLDLDYHIIFNTVDKIVLADQTFKRINPKLIIDLSSKGGFSLSAAKENNITAIKAPGLPGIIAPVTAGEILAETVAEIINSYI